MRSIVVVAGALLSLGSLAAQTSPEEFLKLEPVLQQALKKSAPFVVTVETFGGARRVLAGGGAVDGQGAPRPGRPGGRPKKAPLKDPGFLQTQGRSTGIIIDPDGWILVSRFALNYDPTTILVQIPGGETLHAKRMASFTNTW